MTDSFTNTMFENIESILRDQCGLNKKHPVIAGISGGPDSLCLMETMRSAGYPILVAYFDHRLRPESTVEAQEVGAWLTARGIERRRGGWNGARAVARALLRYAQRLGLRVVLEVALEYGLQRGHRAARAPSLAHTMPSPRSLLSWTWTRT